MYFLVDTLKNYRNLLSNLVKKVNYCTKYFERNWNSIKNTWKGIKSQISLKTGSSNVPIVPSLNNCDTKTNPYDNHFASIEQNTKKKYSIHRNIFQAILRISVIVQYFCNLQIQNQQLTITPLKSHNASGSNSVPYKI